MYPFKFANHYTNRSCYIISISNVNTIYRAISIMGFCLTVSKVFKKIN